MIQINKHNNYWNKEKCEEKALSCKHKKQFCEMYGGGYRYAKIAIS
jgi:hypothetical protein